MILDLLPVPIKFRRERAGRQAIEAPRPELYDLRQDTLESSNQYQPDDARVQESRAMLGQIKAREAPADASKPETRPEMNASATSLPDPKDKIEEQNLLHAAMMASEDDRPVDARTALQKALTLDPKSPTALRQLGEWELQTGDYTQAAQHLKSAMEVRPDDAAAAFHAGQALEKAHDPAGARDALEASLRLLPGQFPARVLLGSVYLDLKDQKAAEDQFEAALLLQSDSVEAQLGLAKAQIANGNFAEAAQSLEALSKTQAKNAEVFSLLSKAYSGMGKSAEAERAEAKAKALR